MSGGREGKRVVIVVKKKNRQQQHSGGSWKVAYADFVTAMMAFFLVMWILGMDPQVKDLIQGYFNNPVGTKKAGGGSNIVGVGNSALSFDARRLALVAREQQRHRFEEVRAEILDRLDGTSGLQSIRAQIEIIVTDEGLRIELIEGDEGSTFFALGSAQLTSTAAEALGLIAVALAELPNDIKLEGHTDAAQYGRSNYSNWELSADRANAARRTMEANGIAGWRVIEVRGYADRELRNPGNPLDPSNRRVSILLPFKEPDAIEVVRPLFDLVPRGAYGGE